MKNLVLSAAILGAASLATACTSLGTVSATWELQDWNDSTKSATAAQCPAGGDTAIVYALPAGDTNMADADKDLFNCTSGGGITAGHIAGSYNVWVDITSHDGATLFARSDVKAVNVADAKTSPVDFQFQVNRGYITGAWTLTHSTGAPADCTGVSGVEFVDTDASNPNNFITDQFDCTAGNGKTYPQPLATYNVSVEALANSGGTETQIGQAALVQGVKLQTGNQTQNIGSVVIMLDPGH
jgi:hypothetical protein